MFCRVLFAAAFIVGVGTNYADAQDMYRPQNVSGVTHTHQSSHSAVPSRRGLPIVHYGYGYVHDPYARGSFEMQDPLKDPLFQAQHKFDSRFPGRYSPSQKRQYQQQVWKLFQR